MIVESYKIYKIADIKDKIVQEFMLVMQTSSLLMNGQSIRGKRRFFSFTDP